MFCPDCGKEMERGYLHAGTMAWVKAARRGLFRLNAPEEFFLARDRWTAQPMEASLCPACGTVVLGGEAGAFHPSGDRICPCCQGKETEGLLQGEGDLVWARAPYSTMGGALADRSSRLLTNGFLSFAWPARRCARCSRIFFSTACLTEEQVRAARAVRRVYPCLLVVFPLLALFMVLARIRYWIWLLAALAGLAGLRLLYSILETRPHRR